MSGSRIARPPIEVTKATSYCVPSALIGPPHAHPGSWQVVYVLCGKGQVRIGDAWYGVRARDLYMIQPGEEHASRDDAGTQPELWELRFSIGRGARIPFALSTIPAIMRDVRDPALMETLRQLIDEFSAREPGWEWLCSLLVEEFLLRVCRLAGSAGAAAAGRAQSAHEEAIIRVRRYIHFHFHEPLTVQGLAREAGMSPRRFAEIFRAVCGRPPMDYVIDVRLDRAAELLREGRLTVSQVADRTGFATVHYFSRVFRRKRGASPSAYRRAWTGPE
ncbi:MAG: helix-turn-helix transcriptional regulator [Armatimonadetes bacterium]|nr:helix-turn-helix transcriptional regulator [Armatimonadota bacterium]